MLRRILLFILLFSAASCFALKPLKRIGQLRNGDLIFHIAATANAITDVTLQEHGLQIDHVAIFFSDHGNPYVVQSIHSGTVVTPLDSLLQEEGSFIVGRMQVPFSPQQSINNALTYVGRPYDFLFLPDNDAIYCSELVLLSFVDRQGNRIFHPTAMSFHDANGAITPHWREFYARHGMEVPEGWPGSNPAELAQRKQLKLIYAITEKLLK